MPLSIHNALVGFRSRYQTNFIREPGLSLRARGRGFPLLATISVALGYFYWKIPKETRRCLISHLLFVFTWQLEILVTTLRRSNNIFLVIFAGMVLKREELSTPFLSFNPHPSLPAFATVKRKQF